MSYTTTDDIWFSGPVEDAIKTVTQSNCVFLVYIHDDSAKTNTLNALLKEEQVTHAIREHTVAIAFDKDSENAKLFGQFYPMQAVPILYFIKQGTIKDFAVETVTSQDIIEKINMVQQLPISPFPQASQLQHEAVSTPAPETEQQHLQQDQQGETILPEAAETDTVNDNIQDSEFSVASNTTSSQSEKDRIEAKKKELQKQLEKVRKERAEREEREAKEREMKRRQEAKMMQEAKQSQVNRENQIYFAKLKQERKEEEAHKRKVREQIARDKAEKIKARNAEKQLQSSSPSLAPQNAAESNSSDGLPSSSSSNTTTAIKHTYSNLNIRQLDGSNIRHKFEATATLSTVRQWIQENRTDNIRLPYKLSSQFPTRLFTEQDDDTTLQDLNLCPSATIIMKPTKKGSSVLPRGLSGSAHAQGGVTGYIYSAYDSIYGFLLTIFNMLTGILATLFPTNNLAHTDTPPSQRQGINTHSGYRRLGGGQRLGDGAVVGDSTSTRPDTFAQRRNPYASRIQTLHDNNNDDDEEDKRRPTYNGNSVNHE